MAIGQSASADETYHSFNCHFYLTSESFSFGELSLTKGAWCQVRHTKVKEKSIPNTYMGAGNTFVGPLLRQ